MRLGRPFISLSNATFRLGDRLVFKKTSWTLHNHEHWAVLGQNGSGKSLLADALRGRLPLVGGELNYHFRPPAGLGAEEAIAHVSFDNRRLTIHETVVQSRWNSLEEEGSLLVRDFLAYERVMDINPFEQTVQLRGARARFESRRRRAINLLRLDSFLDRPLLSLSNGETQRAQLARALCRPMRLLVLDEPFLGLDAAARAHFLAALERLMASPLRVLFITTRPEDLPRHITHVLRVNNCRVTAAGPRHIVLRERPRRTDRLTPSLKLRRGPFHSSSARAKPTRDILLALKSVNVCYGRLKVLRDLNWTVHGGESWALLGPNGSGKTTLLSLIVGDHPQAYANDITVFGVRRGTGESIWEIKRRIGWVSPELHVHFNNTATCFETVASGFRDSIGLFEPPTARQRAEVRHSLRRFGLLKYAQTPLFGLSDGLQRQVLLARALVKKPRLLVLDEPCQGLDSPHRLSFVRTVDCLIRSGSTTVIYVTHRPDEIPPAISRVLRLPQVIPSQIRPRSSAR